MASSDLGPHQAGASTPEGLAWLRAKRQAAVGSDQVLCQNRNQNREEQQWERESTRWPLFPAHTPRPRVRRHLSWALGPRWG